MTAGVSDRPNPRLRRFQAMRRVLAVVLSVDLALAAAKGSCGLLVGSLGMVADGLHSLLHALGAVVGLIGITLAARPPDKSHPYGYERYEPLAALGIIAMMLLAIREIASLAWQRLMAGEAPANNPWSLALVAGSALISLGLAVWEQRQGHSLDSPVLATDGQRAQADVLVTLSVLAGLVANLLGVPLADIMVSIIIAGLIAKSGWTKLRELSAILTDAAAGDLDEIADIVRAVPGVRAVHGVRARGAAGAVRVDLHVVVEPDLPSAQAHDLTHEVAKRVRTSMSGIVEVLIHVGVDPEPAHSCTEHR